MNQRWETGRVEAFSDGVLAIAITLLVLEIEVEPSDFNAIVYGAVAAVIELLMAAATRYAASRPELRAEDAELPTSEPRRGGVRAVLYGIALVLGVLVFPKLAAFGYFFVAALAVLSPRGEGRLTLGSLRGG